MVDAWNNHRCSFVSINSILQFVQIWGQVGQTFFQALPLLGVCADLERFAGGFQGIALHHLPMVKHTLRESLASSIRPQVGGETWNKKGEKMNNLKNQTMPESFSIQNQTSKNHQWLKNLRWKPRMVWKTRISSLKITSEVKKMRTYRKIRWQASKPWRGTWEFREPGSPQIRVHDDDWAHRRFHRQRFQDTVSKSKIVSKTSLYKIDRLVKHASIRRQTVTARFWFWVTSQMREPA